ncbi:MAG: hypothetical protein M1814_002078 [Vezdaea aestivalis]|nr:MAG: hypothetical protein M1814_002078 [Vezdaea aestivalis]
MFKYNWYSIRTSCKQFAGMDASQWQAASILNSDDAAALTCMHEQLAKYPGDVWFIVQRDGAGYLGASMSETAKGYRDAVTNAATYLQSHMTDDWVRSSQIGAQ